MSITLGNWSKNIQTKDIAQEIIGYFPIIDGKELINESHLSFLKCLLFHRCWNLLNNDPIFSKLIELPTINGKEYFYVIIGPYTGDLQELYTLARQYQSNYGKIQRGCHSCSILGSKLNELLPNYPISSEKEDDELIKQSIDYICKNDLNQISKFTGLLKKKSLYPVPVNYLQY